MARQINGHVGTFATVADLSTRFPASEHVGCSANVGVIPPYSKMWSDGYSWNGFNNVDVLALQTLESSFNQTGYLSFLQNKLDAGFGTLAFSRSGANASIVDCYGSMQFCTSSEARFYGARRVENKVQDTENATTGWTFGATPTASLLKSPNHGRKSAWTVSRGSGTTQLVILNSQSYRPGKWCLSVYIWGDGTTQYTIRIERSSDSVGSTQLVVPPAGEWTRVAVSHDIVDTTNHRGIITVATSGAASVTYCDPQMEWVQGQTSPAPSDYVPRGVLTTFLPATAYTSEAGVDGVRYYTTYNPWSLSSGVATRSATVSNIPTSLLKGIAVAGASSSNQVYSSANIGASAWTKNGSTTVNATPADSTLLGKNSLWKLEQGAATQEHRVEQTWRGTVPTTLPTPISASCYAKAGDAACPFVWMWIQTVDGSTNYAAYFNVQTGQVGTVSSTSEAWMVKEGDCWSLNIVIPSGSTGSTPPILRIGVTQTNGTLNPLGTAGNGNWIGAVQFEQGLPTSYMGDTTSSTLLTRNAETLTATSTSMPVINWTVAGDFTCRYPTGSALKPTWLYLLYTYTSQADRGGFGLRPAAFGGFYDGGEDEIFFDWYPGISADNLNWDGIHIKQGSSSSYVTARAMETYRYQWSAGTTATQVSGSNQSGAVGSVLGTSVGNDMPRPALNSWPSTPRIWTIGRSSTSISQRGELYCSNLVWHNFAKTGTQMQLTA